MIRSLHVENYALIDSLDASLSGGLIIITGSTGAGKSILLGALSMLLGAKADASLIGSGDGNCIVEAEFDPCPEAADILQEAELDPDEPLLLRRVLSPTGRSRAFINDMPVQLSLLQELATHLVDIHSQHQTLRLADPAFRLGVLDSFATDGAQLKETARLFKELSSCRKRLAEVQALLSKSTLERDYNQSLFDTLEAAQLRPGEIEELETEQKQLSNAEEIRSNLAAITDALSPEDERPGVDVLLKESWKNLQKASRFVPSLEPLGERMESLRAELSDILSEVEDASTRITVSPSRLEQVEERLSLLYSLMRKHGVSSVEELIAERSRLEETLVSSDELEREKVNLEKQLASLGAAYDEAAVRLHDKRSGALESLSDEILSSLRFLELSDARFRVVLEDAPDGPSGRDSVKFLFSASSNSALVDVAKAASGGELSRIMLTIKSIMGRHSQMPTMIFDEIDTGVSGSAAAKMGSMICSMGEYMQVIAITHLPQVAAKGRSHYLVRRSGNVSTLEILSPEDRVMEIARLLSGETITPAAIANARSLLG